MPAKLTLPWGHAWDVAKLQPGEIAQHIFREGPTPTHLSILFGISIEIDTDREVDEIKIN